MKNRGFTLVEILIASAIALIVGIFLLSILANSNGIFYKQNAIVSEGLSLNDSMSEIDKNIRQATSVADTSDVHTLMLKLSALGVDGMIDNVYDSIIIAKDPDKNNILRKKVIPDVASIRKSEDLVLTTMLDSINFVYLNKLGEIVNPQTATSVSITLSVKSGSGSINSKRSSTIITTLKNAL